MEKQYYSTQDVARICQVSRGTVIRWAHEGKLNAAETAGGHLRILASDLAGFLKNLKLVLPDELQAKEVIPVEKLKVLLVDDEESFRKLLRRYFKDQHPEVYLEEASDGFQAGFLIQKIKPEIVFLDLNLPGMDGFKVCELLRSQVELKDTQVIMMTGSVDESLKEKAGMLGVRDFLRKPFDLAQLSQFVKK